MPYRCRIAFQKPSVQGAVDAKSENWIPSSRRRAAPFTDDIEIGILEGRRLVLILEKEKPSPLPGYTVDGIFENRYPSWDERDGNKLSEKGKKLGREDPPILGWGDPKRDARRRGVISPWSFGCCQHSPREILLKFCRKFSRYFGIIL